MGFGNPFKHFGNHLAYFGMIGINPVSYTHLDVYKRQVTSCPEDSDAWALWHYDRLFVGSDYKGSERFNRYEAYFQMCIRDRCEPV